MSSVNSQIPLRVRLEDEASFENFYPGNKANQELTLYLQNSHPDVLYLYGAPSTGVSHLAIALVKEAEAAGQLAQYVPLEDLQGAPAEMLGQLEDMDLLCFDDIQLIRNSAEWQLGLFHLFNRMREQGGRFVFTGHSVPAQLDIALPDLRSRILAGQTWAVSALNDREKLQALKNRAQLRGFRLSDQVANYLIGHQQRDMAHLMGLLDQLDRLSLEEKKLITLPFVKQLIELD